MKLNQFLNLSLLGAFGLMTACAHSQMTLSSSGTGKSASGLADVNGIKMYYETYGSGEPLVLIHGGGSTIESNFASLIPLLSKSHRIIAIEEVGHGHSPAVSRAFTFENSADDIAALLDQLKVPRADVMGFSNGGNVGMQLAIRHPEKVRKLVVASSMYRRDGLPAGFWDGMKNAKISDMPRELQEADRKINPDPKHLEQLFKQDSERMKAFKDWPDSSLKSISAATLVIVGDHDVITVDHALRMSRLIPNARLTVFAGNHGDYIGEVSSHGGIGPKAEATALLVNEFLMTK